jgi:hypothetical protein
MTRLPRCPGSTLVLWLNQETVHDFVLLFLPPCGTYLTPLATGSLEPSLLVCFTPGCLTSIDLSSLFFTCIDTNQATTCTYNTWLRVSQHHIVNHSSHASRKSSGWRLGLGPIASSFLPSQIHRDACFFMCAVSNVVFFLLTNSKTRGNQKKVGKVRCNKGYDKREEESKLRT